MVLLRCYAAVTGVLVAGYLAWPYDDRQWPFLVVVLLAIPAVVVGLRRAPAGARSPWWILLAALLCYDVGNLIWIWLAVVLGRVTGDGSIADLFITAGGVLVLASAMVLVVQRGRRDVGGVIDSVITAVALTGVLWDSVLLPALTAQHVPATRQAVLFINIFVMAGTLGAMLRVSLIAGHRAAPVRWLATGIAFGLIGNVAGALAVDPVTGLRADWTNMAFLAAYAALGCAALHPAVAEVTVPASRPDDDLTRGRLTFLGIMLALSPLVGGGRAMFGLPTDGILIALSSAGLIPLVMIRIARLSAARRAAELALHHLATSDALTGLPNRAACLDQLTRELESGPDDLAVLFCDLDGFKPVNDRLGHAAGDDLLIEVAARLRSCVRDGDQVSRLGGDEFVIVCRGADAVDVIADRVREMVAAPFTAGGEEVRIGISIGAAHARATDVTDELVGRADLAMYEAKKSKSVGALSLVLH